MANDTDDSARGEMLLTLMLLYCALHERLACPLADLSNQERILLLKLGAPCRMGHLAREMQALPSSVTALADGLEARGMVARRRDPEDRRAWLLELAPAGRAARREMIEQLDRVSREVTGLDETELDTLGMLLLKSRDHIRATGLPKEFSL
ncbi:MarR family winged helix-turn-helix transcriptional regulator [Limimaricola hongkongensis]|uniref:Transcriptional regulator, MarR family protein n=1 Tax=Limimaricola hongkongensis DSM 17492 TaxID=1122180 RepID=A0A017H9B9_9RHOB|nr:MarR family transcriptional regulator [Limimaricola hongkongensis]EYD70915.1 transcriptional regulator, MarR family protein [Limimaricola hongkongensis DSM 17492]